MRNDGRQEEEEGTQRNLLPLSIAPSLLHAGGQSGT